MAWFLTAHKPLTRWGRATHICVNENIIIVSDNGLSPDRRQAIIWTNVGILLIGPLGINFGEFLIEISTFSFKKMHLKMSSAKWRLGLNVLAEPMTIKVLYFSKLIFTEKSFTKLIYLCIKSVYLVTFFIYQTDPITRLLQFICLLSMWLISNHGTAFDTEISYNFHPKQNEKLQFLQFPTFRISNFGYIKPIISPMIYKDIFVLSKLRLFPVKNIIPCMVTAF